MLDLTNQKRIQRNRQYHFHLMIHLASTSIASNLNLSRMQTHSLVDLLLSSNFTSQELLESVLFNLIIIDRSRRISLKDFDGQLEFDSRGIPYWNVYLQTTALITSRCLARSISRKLFKTKNLIDPTIHISPLSNFQQCDREKLFPIPESDFYPGHFSRTVLRFEELLRNGQVIEAIKERPEKYRLLIETKAETKNN